MSGNDIPVLQNAGCSMRLLLGEARVVLFLSQQALPIWEIFGWRIIKSIKRRDIMKTFWVIFLKDPATGAIHGTAYGHNATGDYRTNPYYIGTQQIEVDMSKFKLPGDRK